MSSDPWIGRSLAGHRVLSVIGRGGMSVVYLAEHQGLERRVALKILGSELAEDEAFRERFIRESRVAAELDHPNVVTVFDAGEAEGVLYLSMRYVEGSDLERLLRSEPAIDPSTTADLVAQCAAGLDAAHARGLVHRDVKPGNVLLAPHDGAYHAYLSDFGVTKRIHTGASLTRSGQFVGTVDYVAPEQIRSDDVDARADVYSLACVAFRCLTGDVPFPRDTEVATIYAQLQDPPPAPSERRDGVPAGFDAPIVRALAKDRERRFPSCGAFADAIAVVAAPPPTVARRPSTPPAGAGRRPGRGRVLAGVAAAALVVVVVAVLSWPRPPGGPVGLPPAAPPPELVWNGADPLPTEGAAGAATAAVGVGEEAIVAGWVARDGDHDAAVWTRTAEGGWRLEPSRGFGGSADQRIAAIATDGTVVVAVGSESAREDVDAAVWRSVDGGASWTRVDPVTAGLHHTADQAMLSVIHGPSGWIAAGWDRSEGDADAAVWISDDGTGWVRQGADAFGGIGRQAIAALATVGDRTLAAGWTSGADGDLDGAVWLRTGSGWSRVSADALGGPGDQALWAAAADGQRIAVAGEAATTGPARPAVWTSEDGETWELASGDGLAATGSVRSLVRIDGGWVAGGSTGVDADRATAVWRSSDGVVWSNAAESPDPTGGTAGTIGALVDPGPGRLVAAGSLLASPVAWLADVS